MINTQFLNAATFVGIDAHPTEHTALAMNRFEDEKGNIRFNNTKQGIATFLSWLSQIDGNVDNVVVGIEGEGSSRHALVSSLLSRYASVFEINPLYTKQRRSFGPKSEKSDPVDAKLIADVLTRKLTELPKITREQIASSQYSLRKTVWFYEDVTVQGARLQNHLRQLKREHGLTSSTEEKQAFALIIQEKSKNLRSIRDTQKKVEAQLKTLLIQHGKNLVTIPGINTILAAKIAAHVNGIERFKTIDKFIRYAGIAPVEKSSGKTKRFIKNRRGNRKLNAAFYLAALNQTQWNPKAKVYYQKKMAEGKSKKQALMCVMKRIACIVYGMLKNGEAYRG